MVQLYLVRHGKTIWNQEHRLQGARGDSPLIEGELYQIDALAKRIQNLDYVAIYSSPLKRALDTAKRLVNSLNNQNPIQISEALREIDFGNLEGKRNEELPLAARKQLGYFFNEPEKYNASVVRAESYQQAAKRTNEFVLSLVDHYSNNSKIILVSHGGILNVMINSLLGIPLKDYRRHGGITNASLTRIDVEGNNQARLVDFNNTDHLKNINPSDTI